MPIKSTLGAVTTFKPTTGGVISFWYQQHTKVYANGLSATGVNGEQGFSSIASDSLGEKLLFGGQYVDGVIATPNLQYDRSFIVIENQSLSNYTTPNVVDKFIFDAVGGGAFNDGEIVSDAEYNSTNDIFVTLTNKNKVVSIDTSGNYLPNYSFTYTGGGNLREMMTYGNNITVIANTSSNSSTLMNYDFISNTKTFEKTISGANSNAYPFSSCFDGNNYYVGTRDSILSITANGNVINWQYSYQNNFSNANIVYDSLLLSGNNTIIGVGFGETSIQYITKIDATNGNVIWSKSSNLAGPISPGQYFATRQPAYDLNKDILICVGNGYNSTFNNVMAGINFIDGNGNTICTRTLYWQSNPSNRTPQSQSAIAVNNSVIIAGNLRTSNTNFSNYAAYSIKLPSDGTIIGNGFYDLANTMGVNPYMLINLTYQSSNVTINNANIIKITSNYVISNSTGYTVSAANISNIVSPQISPYYANVLT